MEPQAVREETEVASMRTQNPETPASGLESDEKLPDFIQLNTYHPAKQKTLTVFYTVCMFHASVQAMKLNVTNLNQFVTADLKPESSGHLL